MAQSLRLRYRGLDLTLTEVSHEYTKGSTVYFPCVQSTSALKTTMVGFGTPAPTRAAGTYVKLLAKTAKYIRPFSKYDGITGRNEEEYLVNFNTAFKVMWAAAVQPIGDGITRSNNSPRLTRVSFQVRAVLSHE